jgi:predicted TIM-barrel fold metal-dependent hydrolase
MTRSSTDRHEIDRQPFVAGAGVAGVAAAAALSGGESAAQESGAVPNSAGTEAPKLKAPAGACDCHHHIYDARFPFALAGARMIANARVPDYRMMQRLLGTSRNIVVTPVPFPASLADNSVTLDALAAFGGNARGVAIVYPAMTDAELRTLHDGGVRGIRFSLAADGGPGKYDMIEPLAKRIAPLGWHVQINMTADQFLDAGDLWDRLPTPIVIDHMGHIPQPAGVDDPAYKRVRALIDKGRTWVKLSVTYDSSKVGPPGYADVNKVGAAYVAAAPERLVWGSNWPHPNETAKPDDALLFDLLAQWAPNEATRRRILVENPETLYGFPKVS